MPWLFWIHAHWPAENTHSSLTCLNISIQKKKHKVTVYMLLLVRINCKWLNVTIGMKQTQLHWNSMQLAGSAFTYCIVARTVSMFFSVFLWGWSINFLSLFVHGLKENNSNNCYWLKTTTKWLSNSLRQWKGNRDIEHKWTRIIKWHNTNTILTVTIKQ